MRDRNVRSVPRCRGTVITYSVSQANNFFVSRPGPWGPILRDGVKLRGRICSVKIEFILRNISATARCGEIGGYPRSFRRRANVSDTES